ncbi:MAG TPA: hypothetical protein VFL13_01445 [Candidatus Baltobacteraceae bacterium]|nr:hypothetical protein [Candidatus Baltobacteraceae bacterium]
MGWDAAAAVGSIAGAFILLGGTIAAIVQLRHLRLTYQIEAYLDVAQRSSSPDMVAAREYVESLNLDDPRELARAFENGLDSRIMLYGGHMQSVSRLINLGIADPRLFAPFRFSAAAAWRALRPIAYELRRRTPGNLRWLDIEYLVYRNQFDLNYEALKRGYSTELVEAVGFRESIEIAHRHNAEALGTPGHW